MSRDRWPPGDLSVTYRSHLLDAQMTCFYMFSSRGTYRSPIGHHIGHFSGTYRAPFRALLGLAFRSAFGLHFVCSVALAMRAGRILGCAIAKFVIFAGIGRRYGVICLGFRWRKRANGHSERFSKSPSVIRFMVSANMLHAAQACINTEIHFHIARNPNICCIQRKSPNHLKPSGELFKPRCKLQSQVYLFAPKLRC